MNICIIGTGYVGLVTGACIANNGHSVVCIDNIKEKINDLNSGKISSYEPDLEKIINKNRERLSFSTDIGSAVKKSDVCIIAVGTPQNSDGSVDFSFVINACKDIAKAMNKEKMIVIKSTVPPKSFESFERIIKENTVYTFELVSNPEFLSQGSAVKNFLNPDRLIIGTTSQRAREIMKKIYSHCPEKIINMDIESALMVKYTANAFLAMKISFINEISNLAEKIGADINIIKEGIGTDRRIGKDFLNAGLGYGGSCLPKDIKALINIGENLNTDMSILKAVDYTNSLQRELFIKKIISNIGKNLYNKTFAVWGLSFKPNTDDMRNAPSVTIIKFLLTKGAKVRVYDPKAINNASKIFQDKITYCEKKEDALKNANALLILTEWEEFKTFNYSKTNIPIFDGRNICKEAIKN